MQLLGLGLKLVALTQSAVSLRSQLVPACSRTCLPRGPLDRHAPARRHQGFEKAPQLERGRNSPPGEDVLGPVDVDTAPTRELAAQIAEVCDAVAKSTHHRVLSVVGGVSYNGSQISNILSGRLPSGAWASDDPTIALAASVIAAKFSFLDGAIVDEDVVEAVSLAG